MYNYYIRCCLLIAICITVLPYAHATHNRAGEINLRPAGGDCINSLTLEATVTTYTKAEGADVDRDSVEVCWGDGTCSLLPRINGNGELLPNNIRRNIYRGTHAYGARGSYRIGMLDPNRVSGILNVNPPNSVSTLFYIETTYTFGNPQFTDCNNTPILTEPPVDVACVGQVFTHNPGAFDIDRDSLSFQFTVPLEGPDDPVNTYRLPDLVAPGPNNQINIDPDNGQIVWNTPQQPGEYNVAIMIIEYRGGIPLDTMIRDMQILVIECDNRPPEITTSIEEICVIAGQTVEIEVTATAPLFEEGQKVRITANGGPFEVPVSPATFEPDNESYQEDPFTRTFRWETSCEHISDEYYLVVFKAMDDFFGGISGLATHKVVRIKVVGPPPEDLRAAPGQGQMEVSWQLPYSCENAQDEYFRGFTVWRRESSNNFPLDTCTPGLSGRGYAKLNTVPLKDIQDGRYYYLDTDVESGRTYCYRVLAVFARTSASGIYTYNLVESLPSEEACEQLGRDIPLITHVDVQETDFTNGAIRVCWSKPKAEDLDTLANPGPYRYEVLRASGITGNEADFLPIGISFSSSTFAGANDTCFVDTDLNTVDNPYSYRIRFYTSGKEEPLGTTPAASSVFLSIAPTDNANLLTWEEQVPWDNYLYVVYRQTNQGLVMLDTVAERAYRHEGLANGLEYCYLIRSIGTYSIEEIINPILNYSQKSCGVPVDNVPPCSPEAVVENLCDQGLGGNCNEVDLVNTIRWTNPEERCVETDDVMGYNIYYSPVEGSEPDLIATIENPDVSSFEHRPQRGIAGCYAVTTLDSMFRNESELSEIICVDNCPFYELPNTFTPNGDGQNDIFRPYPYCFIESVDFKVFNRWGQLVFQTSNPELDWNGRNRQGKDLTEGVYYYTCQVFEQRVSGTARSTAILRGYIELIRGNNR